MRKEFINYVSDMISFYKKHRRFIIKVMAIYAAFCAAIMAYGRWYHEINEFLQRIKMKVLGKREELASGGLDCESPEEEKEEGDDDSSVIASF